MARSTKQSWLEGPGDLKEADVEDVPVEGESIRVRGLPAAYSNEALYEALETTVGARGEQSARVNTVKMEEIQFAYGCVDPTFTVAEARTVSRRFGPAFKKVIAEIDRLSGVDKEAIEQTEQRFPTSGTGEVGSDRDADGAGDDGSVVPARVGA